MEIPASDLIHTISTPGKAESRVKGSKFIAVSVGAATGDARGKIIRSEKKKYHDASHHCWAWRSLTGGREEFAYNDDGEPAGTAGSPILKAIEGTGLSGVVVVVTRYFGGVKLGAGGLARAYSAAAGGALLQAGKIKGMLAEEFFLTFEYPMMGIVNKLAERGPATITSRRFEEKVGLNIAVSRSRAESFISNLTESSAGRIKIKHLGNRPVFFRS